MVTLLQSVPTIKVKFWNFGSGNNSGFTSNKSYTYKTNIPLEINDLVVVEVKGEYKVVQVVSLDPIPAIETNCDYPLKWIISKVNLENYARLQKHDETCNTAIQKVAAARQRKEMLTALHEDLGEKETKELIANSQVTLLK